MTVKTRARVALAALCVLNVCTVTACSKDAPPETAEAPAPPPPPPPPPAEHVPPPEEAAPAAQPTTQIISDAGFATPECVLHDPEQDVYFVSNVQGEPLAADGKGFIAKLSPDGQVQADFIVSGQNQVTLNAPKGMTLVDDTLLVADIDRVRLFDRVTGAPKGDIPIQGATFVNALATGTDGKTVYISDTGLNKEFKPSGTQAVYKLVAGKVTKLSASADLGGPNGLLPGEGGVWVGSFGSGELYWLSHNGKREKAQKLPKGSLDGVVQGDDGTLYVSSWEASAVFAGTPGGEFREIISGVDAPAAIGLDKKRHRLLIPLFNKNSVVLHEVTSGDAATEAAAPTP